MGTQFPECPSGRSYKGGLFVISRRLLARGISVLIAGVAVSAVAVSPSWAGPTGMVDASRKVVKQMVVDLGSSNPARCQDAQLTRSNKNWGVFVLASPVPANCMAYDGYSIVHKKNGKWTNVTGGSSYPCSLFTETLRRNGAPTSVIKDFKSAGYCNRGE